MLARAELEGGDRAAAAAWVARGEETVRGLELPLADAWVLHARALLALADGDAARRAALALRAAERAEAVHAPVPAARCRTLAGVALARAGDGEQAVRGCSRAAQRALAACEANRYRDEAARELRRLGQPRQRAPAPLRRRARASARSAAASSRSPTASRSAAPTGEIADELFLSQKTVEGHLTSVFAKLGVSRGPRWPRPSAAPGPKPKGVRPL